MVVTHDARLIEATECRLWIVDEQEVTPWQGMIRHSAAHGFGIFFYSVQTSADLDIRPLNSIPMSFIQ